MNLSILAWLGNWRRRPAETYSQRLRALNKRIRKIEQADRGSHSDSPAPVPLSLRDAALAEFAFSDHLSRVQAAIETLVRAAGRGLEPSALETSEAFDVLAHSWAAIKEHLARTPDCDPATTIQRLGAAVEAAEIDPAVQASHGLETAEVEALRCLNREVAASSTRAAEKWLTMGVAVRLVLASRLRDLRGEELLPQWLSPESVAEKLALEHLDAGRGEEASPVDSADAVAAARAMPTTTLAWAARRFHCL